MNKCKRCGKDISEYEIYCDECKILLEKEKEEEQIPKYADKEDMKVQTNKKHKKIIIIISSCIAVLMLILVIIIVSINKSNNKSEDKENENAKEEDKISKAEYEAIIDAYGKAAEVASKNYITINKGIIPEFKDIKKSIIFTSYDVKCKTGKVNYDGSVYLSKCKVNKKYSYDYEYGKEKEKPKKSGNKIYLYKSGYDNSYMDAVTGDKISYSGYYVSSYEEDSEYSKKVATYECDNKCQGYDYSDVLEVMLVYDGNYYLYNFNSGSKEKININDKVDSMMFVEGEYKTLGIQITQKDTYKNAFYSFKNNKVVTSYKYDYIYTLNNLSNRGYILATKNGDSYVIDYNTGNEYKTISGYSGITEEYVVDSYYYKASSAYGSSKIIMNSNFEKLIDGNYDSAFNNDGTITVKFIKDSNYNLYDRKGNFISKSNDYKQIAKVLKDYVVVLDENKISILDNNQKLVANLGEIEDGYEIHPMISGWYSKDGKVGIYVVVENKNIPYGQEGSSIEYYYIPATKEVGSIKDIGVGGYAKPILYLYPTKKTDITVSFEKTELLTTTYPKYKNNWKVTAFKNGDLYDSKGKYYYGLYWEENGSSKVDFSKGFYVTKDNAIDFLEEKLEIIGLNKREANEFIMYWLPILEKNEKSLVYFELTNERQKYNKIKITPKPDSLLRVAIHVKKVNNKGNIKEQKLTTFKRVGYTAVEWGGVIH